MHFRAFQVVVRAVRILWVLLVAFAVEQGMFWIQINDRVKVRYKRYCTNKNGLYILSGTIYRQTDRQRGKLAD